MTVGLAVATRSAATLETIARQLRADPTAADIQRLVCILSSEAQLLSLLAETFRKVDDGRPTA
jgi:hypothetical protein